MSAQWFADLDSFLAHSLGSRCRGAWLSGEEEEEEKEEAEESTENSSSLSSRCTVDTCLRQSTEAFRGDYFWKMFRIQRIAWFDIGYNICVSSRSLLGDDFVEMFVFSAGGSTVDTCSHVCYGALGVHHFPRGWTRLALFALGVWTFFVGPVSGSHLFGVFALGTRTLFLPPLVG